MEYDLQIIVDLFVLFCTVGFPIGLVMCIAEKLVDIMKRFILGKKVVI